MNTTPKPNPATPEALLAAMDRAVAGYRGIVPGDRVLVTQEGWDALCRAMREAKLALAGVEG